jgi:hypothetical protein
MSETEPVIEATKSTLDSSPEVKDKPKKKKVQKTSKKWKCNECGFPYISPIPVVAVEHKCIHPPLPGTTRKGMLPED